MTTSNHPAYVSPTRCSETNRAKDGEDDSARFDRSPHRVVPSVLIVDDDAELRETIASVLRDERFIVATAGNGRAALDLLRGGFRPTAVLLDLWMPHTDGEATLAAMKADAELGAIPVIVITASLADKRTAPVLAQAARVMHKPLDLDDLIAAVEEHALGKRTL